MSTHLYLVLFVVMAIAMNIVVYIGVTMVYVSEKRRGKASRASDDPATHAAASRPGDRRYGDKESQASTVW